MKHLIKHFANCEEAERFYIDLCAKYRWVSYSEFREPTGIKVVLIYKG